MGPGIYNQGNLKTSVTFQAKCQRGCVVSDSLTLQGSVLQKGLWPSAERRMYVL